MAVPSHSPRHGLSCFYFNVFIICFFHVFCKLKLKCLCTANAGDVAEAIRLFKFSTLQAASNGVIAQGQGSAAFRKQIQNAEDFIRARLPINQRMSRQYLLNQYLSA